MTVLILDYPGVFVPRWSVFVRFWSDIKRELSLQLAFSGSGVSRIGAFCDPEGKLIRKTKRGVDKVEVLPYEGEVGGPGV